MLVLGIDIEPLRQQPLKNPRIGQGHRQMQGRFAFIGIAHHRVGAGLLKRLQDGDVDTGATQRRVKDRHGVAWLEGQRHAKADAGAQHRQMGFRESAEKRLAQAVHRALHLRAGVGKKGQSLPYPKAKPIA